MDSIKHEMAEAVHQLLADRLKEFIEAEDVFADFDVVDIEVKQIDDLTSMIRLKTGGAPRYFAVKVSESL